MQIIHKIDDFLYTIFPELMGGGKSLIISVLENYYTYGPFKPKVNIENDWVIIDIDTPTILSQETDYRKTVSLCEKGKYSEAKPILIELIRKNPTNSEYHRIMGQILSDEGNQDEAIDCLIDALRWDSKNGYALLMMGNIYAKFRNDIPIAMKYYDQALLANPNDNITINNIATNLLQQGKIIEAKKYFWEAIKINDTFPNTHFALGLIAEKENDLHSAFHSTIQSIKLNNNKDILFQNSLQQALSIANKVISKNEARKIYKDYKYKLEFQGGTEIEITEDTNIPTAAKIEFAENYNRKNHMVRFNPKYPAYEHLIMHELVHLDLVIEARKLQFNQLFISTQEHKTDFIKKLEPSIRKFHKMGVFESSIANYCTGLFEGLNRQVYNTPIDLFIEYFLYNQFPDLRPVQFISLNNLVREGLTAVTDKKAIELSPPEILSKSKIYNIVNALLLKDLFGINLIKDFNAMPFELKQAQTFYDEFLEYKDDKKPGEEYELVLHWAEDLKLNNYFELVSEAKYRTRSNIDSLIQNLEKDPLGIEEKDPIKDREMQKFQKSQEQIGTNMAIAMFMVDALHYFDNMPISDIKKIAFEIAMQGTQGYSPDKKDYRINSIPEKVFTGYQILAYYYVSWMLAMPTQIEQLQLPFENEYKIALNTKNQF